MEQWVPFAEGEYLVESAFLATPDNTALDLEKGVIEVFQDAGGRRQLRGSARVRPYLMVELMEENDAVDLILDLGDEFKYRLPRPTLRSGKVFSRDVKAVVQFFPTRPWEPIARETYAEMRGQLSFLSP